MHSLLVVTDSSENDDRQLVIVFANERDERNPIHFRHFEVDDGDIAILAFEPGSGLETISQGIAGMTFLLEIGDEKFCNRRVIINDEELGAVSSNTVHLVFHNFHIESKH